MPLARVTAVEDLVPALAEALDVKEAEGRTNADGLAALIREMRVPLILDNLEQVIAAAPASWLRIRRTRPDVSTLKRLAPAFQATI